MEKVQEHQVLFLKTIVFLGGTIYFTMHNHNIPEFEFLQVSFHNRDIIKMGGIIQWILDKPLRFFIKLENT